jgi:flagellar export protein FliJ
MHRFRFRLERVLWHRRLAERIAQQALGEALRVERVLAADLERLRGRCAEGAAALRAALDRPTPGSEVMLHARYAAGLASRGAALAERRAEVFVVVEERRAAVRERRRGREVLVSLRDRALARYRRAAECEAQRVLDETAGTRHARRLAQHSE